MLSPEEIGKLAARGRTSEGNVAREYAQHVVLARIYDDPAADRLCFKGGTALRILHGSPRFSEDLDFTGAMPFYGTQRLIERVAVKARQEIEGIRLVESKRTSGGYFGVLGGPVGPWEVEIRIQASLRKASVDSEMLTVLPPMGLAYNVVALREESLVAEKLEALLTRAKPRDFYDLYFILRKPLGDRKHIASKRKAILDKLASAGPKALYRELREFLPRSHWAIIRQLPAQLQKEMGRL